MALTIDGQNTTANSTTTSITTTKTNNIILLFQAGETNDPATSVTDAAGLTWTKIGNTVSVINSGPSFTVGTAWWAFSSGILTGNTITCHGSSADGRLAVVAINGANTTTPLDPDASNPATGTSSAATTLTVSGLSTTNANCILIAWVRNSGAGNSFISGPAGFTQVQNCGGFTAQYYKIVSAQQSSVSETMTFGGSALNAMVGIFVAVQAPSSSSPAGNFLMFME